MKKYVVFDIDGTLAVTEEKHLVYLKTEPKNWDAFHIASSDNKVNVDVYDLYLSHKDAECDIVVLTARNEKYRDLTEAWLKKQGIEYSKLLMRKSDDFRKDGLVKYDELQELEREYGVRPLIIYDDSDCVISMMLENGYNFIDAKKFWS